MEKMPKNEKEWKKRLSMEQFRVLRKKGTEIPFTGKLLFNKEKGIYSCAGCGEGLFSSDAKFESGTGWPSFFEPLDNNKIIEKEDLSHGMKRTEILCKKCGGHLGHLFNDGPTPTGLRYCVNSCSLDFKREATKNA